MALLVVDTEGEFVAEIRDAPPAHLLVKIQSFSNLWKHGIRKHESVEFVAGIYKWRLIIYPQVSESDNVSVYLSVADAESLPVGWVVKAKCSILLRNQTSDNYFCFHGKSRRFDATNSRWGFSISKRMLNNGYLVDDKCTFFSPKHMKMKLFPNGEGDAKGKSLSIFLECVDSKAFSPRERVKADFCIRIKNMLPHAHRSKQASHWFTLHKVEWGFRDFIPITVLRDPSKGFITNGCCFLETQISVQLSVYTTKVEGP